MASVYNVDRLMRFSECLEHIAESARQKDDRRNGWVRRLVFWFYGVIVKITCRIPTGARLPAKLMVIYKILPRP